MDTTLTLPRTTTSPGPAGHARVDGAADPRPMSVVAAVAVLLHRYTTESTLVIGVEGDLASRLLTLTVDGGLTLGEVADQVAAALDPAATDQSEAVEPLAVVTTRQAGTLDAPLLVRVADHRVDVSLTRALDDGAAAQYAAHLGRVLEELQARPEVLVRDADLLSEAEHAHALEAWNDTDLRVPEGYIHELVTEHALATPDAVAVSTRGVQVTYRELDDAANQLAHRLTRLGVRRGDRVGVLLPRGSDALVAQLAAFKVVAAAVLLDPDFPHERTRFMTEESGAAVVLAVAEDGAAVEGLCPVVRLDQDDWRAEPTTPVREPVTADDLIHVAYTSGSTGVPKAVLARFGPARNTIHGMRALVDMTEATHGTWLAAPGYGMIQVECFPVLAAGARCTSPRAASRPPPSGCRPGCWTKGSPRRC